MTRVWNDNTDDLHKYIKRLERHNDALLEALGGIVESPDKGREYGPDFARLLDKARAAIRAAKEETGS